MCGLPVALSVTVTAAVRVPDAVGLNVTLIVQLAPALTELPQVLLWAKSPAFVPVTATLVMLSAALPLQLISSRCSVGSGANSVVGIETRTMRFSGAHEMLMLGTASHHWSQTSCAAHPLGFKGMHVAAKVLGASLVDLLTDPQAVAQAKQEFARSTQGKPYVSPLAADAKPQVF